MRTLLIACRTLADEVELALRETGTAHERRWIEPGLDARPDVLRARLQAELEQVRVPRVLLAFGYCGHALLGLRAGAFELIFPRADDCISLVLGSSERRESIAGEAPTYFVTEGWLDHESNIWDEYRRAVSMMGAERARQAFALILGHYKRLGVIDTGVCPPARLLERTREIAATLGLQHHVIPGSMRYLRRLVAGPWEGEFVTIPPGGTVTLDLLL
jgi:hypothetical protein